jgi:hypothetical protein
MRGNPTQRSEGRADNVQNPKFRRAIRDFWEVGSPIMGYQITYLTKIRVKDRLARRALKDSLASAAGFERLPCWRVFEIFPCWRVGL